MGIAYIREKVAEGWRPYKVRPAADEPVGRRFETGTLAHELLAGFVAAVEYLDEIGWDFIEEHERALGQRFLDGLPAGCHLYGVKGMDTRVPTFAFNVEGHSPQAVAEYLGAAGVAVWHGNYYAVEIMNRLSLPEGAVRVGVVHYNTESEVDGVLSALADLAAG